MKGNVNSRVLMSDGRIVHRHVDQLLPRRANNSCSDEILSDDYGMSVPETLLNPGKLVNPVVPTDNEPDIVDNGIPDAGGASVPMEGSSPTRIPDTGGASISMGGSSPTPSMSSAVAARRSTRERPKPVRFRDEQ